VTDALLPDATGRQGRLGKAAALETTGLTPVARESTASIIANQLREAIVRGAIRPGSQLSEADLALQFGVSRGPLREAMQRLVQEGIVRSERNRGLFVIVLDNEDVDDIYTARSAVEGAALALAMRRDRAGAAASLNAVCEEMRASADRGDSTALSDADLRFHETLVAKAGSPRMARMHATLLAETRICLTALEESYRPSSEVVHEHQDIVQALLDGDQERALQLLDAHMEDARTRLSPARLEPDRTRQPGA
jgi:DNA-binding GntR family transcriptional regulator